MEEPKEHIWIPKAICLVSTLPYYDFFTNVLIDLYFTVFHDHCNKEDAKNFTQDMNPYQSTYIIPTEMNV